MAKFWWENAAKFIILTKWKENLLIFVNTFTQTNFLKVLLNFENPKTSLLWIFLPKELSLFPTIRRKVGSPTCSRFLIQLKIFSDKALPLQLYQTKKRQKQIIIKFYAFYNKFIKKGFFAIFLYFNRRGSSWNIKGTSH